MKYDKGFHQKKEKKSIFRFCPKIPSHAPFQIVMTILQVVTAVLAFIFVATLEGHVARLNANYAGELKNTNRPCARRALEVCQATTMDRCQEACCPAEYYMCSRDPTVGLFCQDRETPCGNFDFCLDISDVPGTCEREECQRRTSVRAMTQVVFVVAAIGVGLDLFDLIWCCALADNVLLKSITNFIACLAKWLAFGGILGVDTEEFLTDHIASKCFNPAGMVTLGESHLLFQLGAATLFVSGFLSLCMVPMSAMFGGRLADRPMYEMKVMDLGG